MQSTESAPRVGTRDGTRYVSIPAVGLTELRRRLQREAGALATIRALHAAGYRAGQALWESLSRGSAREPLTELDGRAFWERLSAVLGGRGWGSFTHRTVHPGIGLLESRDWAEADAHDTEQSSCSLSTGLMAGLLTGAAAGPIAVLETSCRTRGDERCTFAFGATQTVHDLYGLLLDGHSLESALSCLRRPGT